MESPWTSLTNPPLLTVFDRSLLRSHGHYHVMMSTAFGGDAEKEERK